jgi:hypothetical protein
MLFLACTATYCSALRPPSVSSFGVSNVGVDNLTVVWGNYFQPAMLLDLRWRKVGEQKWTYGLELQMNVTQHTATGLEEGSRIEFSIQALSLDGEYSEPTLVQGETLAETRATNVRASEVYERSIKVTWKTAKTAGVSQKLYVSWDGGETWRFNTISTDGPMLTGTTAEFFVQSLIPDSGYMFRVDTLSLGSGGAVKSVPSPAVRSLPASPRSLGGLQAIAVTDTSMQVQWKPLTSKDEIGASSVSYIVEVREGVSSAFPDPTPFRVVGLTNLTINGLLRNTAYRIRATAVNDRNLASSSSPALTVTTRGSIPQQPAAPKAEILRGAATGVLVTWASLETNGATGGYQILRYVIHKKRQDEQQFDAGLDVGLSTSYVFTTNLSTNYLYQFAVSASNVLGSSPMSGPSNSVLPPIAPLLAPPRAEVSRDARGSLITLTWAAPAPASNVMAYKVFVRQVAPSSVFDSGYMVYQPIAQFAYLPDHTQFEFKVAALTGVGWTEPSSITTAETRDDSIPTSAAAFFVPTCTLNVTWTPPRRTPVAYRIFRMDIINNVSSTTMIAGSRRWHLVQDCSRGTTFTFSVQVLAREQPGPRSCHFMVCVHACIRVNLRPDLVIWQNRSIQR